MRWFGGPAALVVALTALVVALGGTALATSYVITSSSQIKDGAVTGADVKDRSLTGTDLKDGSVASVDVKDGSLAGADVKDRSLSPKDFNGSVTGPPGPQGPAGPRGETGAIGPSDTYTGYSPQGTIVSNSDPPSALVGGTQAPPGSYVLQANIVVTNRAATANEVGCRLLAGADAVDVAYVTLDAAGGLDTQTLALAGTATLGAFNLVQFACSGDFDYVDFDVIATRVGTLH